MSIMKDMLGSDESLFKNEIALDYSFIPKLIPYRETQQRYIASCIKPLFQQRNGKNLLVYGQPGIGKTVACKHLFNELEEETEEVIPIYVNCWQKNTTFKVILEICDVLGYKLTHNKKTEELVDVIKNILNKKSVVFCFDEIDKAEDFDFLYMILEEIYRKTILLITNYKSWFENLDDRIRSRLMSESLEFKPYNLKETKGILKQRMEYAFVPGVWLDDAFDFVAAKTAELEDIRSGLYLMKESANTAESLSSKNIRLEHCKEAIKKLDDFSIKKSSELAEDERKILSVIKENSGKKIGEIYKVYCDQGNDCVYKTFQRKIKKLQENKFISLAKTEGGKEGNTTIVKYIETTKKLTDFS